MSLLRVPIAVLVSLLVAWHAFGAAQLVKTINTFVSTGSSDPFALPTVGNPAYFLANDFDGSSRVWKTDGTTAGTVPVTGTIEATTEKWMVTVGETTWFSKNDGIHGTELWKSDGTEAGTVMVKDIRPGHASSLPAYFWPGGDLLYFTADDGVHGRELWRTDGTTAGTWLVKDITAGTGFGPQPFGQSANGFLFTADDALHGSELWATDGTEAGTRIVKDVREGAGSLWWSDFAFVGGVLYMSADDGVHGVELWKSDGTEAGTVMVKDIVQGSGDGVFELAVLGNEVVMSVYDATTYRSLWKSDGTEAGTVLVSQISCGRLLEWGTRVAFFSTQYTITPQNELWLTDGTSAGTQQIAPIPGTGTNDPRMVAGSSRFFFWHGGALWTSDGTASGTKAVRSFPNGPPGYPQMIGTIGDVLLLKAWDSTTGSEMWRSDGTSEGTFVLRDIADRYDGVGASILSRGVSIGDQVLFRADDGTHGVELWKSDGTANGTALVKDVVAGTSTPFAELSRVGNAAFYGQWTGSGSTNVQPWRSDGTADGTSLVAEISLEGIYTRFTDLGGVAWFAATDGTTGTELWKSSGSGATRVADINPGSASSSPSSIVAANGKVYFAADDGMNGIELWASDGDQTSLVKDIRAAGSSTPRLLTAVGSEVWFFADDGTNGVELWRTNGTADGTSAITTTLAEGFDVAAAIAIGNRLFFATMNELWSSDGTEDGTIRLRTFATGIYTATRFDMLFDVGGKLVFFADDGTHGGEPWVSDGTAAGTTLLRDISAGMLSSATQRPATVFDGKLFFVAKEDLYGAELWMTDGTAAGTKLAADVATAFASSSPLILPATANEMLFLASTYTMGYQLYRYVCGPPSSLSAYAGPNPVVAGEELQFHVMPFGNEAFCYDGTVSVTSNDPAAVLPDSYTFGSGETEHMFPVTLKTAGSRKVTASDGTRTINVTVTVKAAAADPDESTIVASQATAATSQQVTITVTLVDPYGNAVTNANVALQTTHGTLSAVTNQGNGTYAATLTATSSGSATVSGTASGVALTSTATVSFVITGATTVTATALTTTSVDLAWTAALGATAYDVYRGNALVGTFPGLSTTVTGLTPATTYLFRVQPRADTALGPLSAPDLATTVLFSNDPIVPRVTPVKRQHVSELLAAINAVRAAASLAPVALRDLTGAVILASDVQSLRDALVSARTALGFATAWTDPSLPSSVIRAVHVEELRNAVK